MNVYFTKHKTSSLSNGCGFFLNIVQVAHPEGEVITEQLHDGGRITVLVFLETIKISDCVIKGLLGQFASNVRAAQNLIVEHRPVKNQTQSDRVGALQIFCFCVSFFVTILCLLDNPFTVVTGKEFSKIAEVISFHFQIENFGVSGARVRNELVLEQTKHIVADVF